MKILVNAIVQADGRKSKLSYEEEHTSAFEAIAQFRRDVGTDFVSATARSYDHGDASKFDPRRPWLHYYAA